MIFKIKGCLKTGFQMALKNSAKNTALCFLDKSAVVFLAIFQTAYIFIR